MKNQINFKLNLKVQLEVSEFSLPITPKNMVQKRVQKIVQQSNSPMVQESTGPVHILTLDQRVTDD